MAITLTEEAAGKIAEVFAAQDMPPDACLRVGIKGGGCSGFSYTLDVTGEPADDDEVFTTGNLSKVMPITRVEDRELQPGPLFRRARELYWDYAHGGGAAS